MRSLKNHISVILSLFVLLFSVQFSIVIYKIIQDQNQKLIKNYSILLVTNKKIDTQYLQKIVKDVNLVSQISPKKIVDKLKNSMSSENLTILKISLPYFYSVTLNTLPGKERLGKIKSKLLALKEVTRVEIFTKTYESIYQILQILQLIAYIFTTLIALMSILLLFKQIRIWVLEHEEKIKIMGYFGANYWIKSAFLYKLVLIDSFISTSLVSAIFIYLPKSLFVQKRLDILNINIPKFNIIYDSSVLFCVSLLLSLFIVTIVSKKMSKK